MPVIGNPSSSGKKPTIPTIGTAVAGNAQATVPFTAPSYTGKGGTVTYRATSNPGSIQGTNTSTPITVTGLSNGTPYTFTVTAETAYGVNSDASSASNSITPVAPIYFINQSTNTAGVYTKVQRDTANTRNVALTWYGPSPTFGPMSNTGTFSAGKTVSGINMWNRTASFTTDSSGNIYFTGYRTSDNLAVIVMKFNSSLVLQWQRQLVTTTNRQIYGEAITVDNSGNVYVGGRVRTNDSPANYRGFVASWDSAGTLRFQKFVGGSADGSVLNLYFNGSVIIITGFNAYSFVDPDYFYDYYWVPMGTDGSFASSGYRTRDRQLDIGGFSNNRYNTASGYAYMSFRQDATTVNWIRNTGVGDFVALDVVADSSNNTYYVGQFSSQCFITKFDSSGNVTWQRRMTTVGTNTAGWGVGLGQGGQVMVGSEYQTTVGGVNRPLTIFSLNPDGSGAGTYSVNGRSFTYVAGSVTFATPANPSVATYTLTNANSSYTESAATATVSDYTITSAVQGLS